MFYKQISISQYMEWVRTQFQNIQLDSRQIGMSSAPVLLCKINQPVFPIVALLMGLRLLISAIMSSTLWSYVKFWYFINTITFRDITLYSHTMNWPPMLLPTNKFSTESMMLDATKIHSKNSWNITTLGTVIYASQRTELDVYARKQDPGPSAPTLITQLTITTVCQKSLKVKYCMINSPALPRNVLRVSVFLRPVTSINNILS